MGLIEFFEAKATNPERHEVILLNAGRTEWFECSCGEVGKLHWRGTLFAQVDWSQHLLEEKLKLAYPIGSKI